MFKPAAQRQGLLPGLGRGDGFDVEAVYTQAGGIGGPFHSAHDLASSATSAACAYGRSALPRPRRAAADGLEGVESWRALLCRWHGRSSSAETRAATMAGRPAERNSALYRWLREQLRCRRGGLPGDVCQELPQRTRRGPNGSRRIRGEKPSTRNLSRACSISGRPPSGSIALSRPMRVLWPPARTKAFIFPTLREIR